MIVILYGTVVMSSCSHNDDVTLDGAEFKHSSGILLKQMQFLGNHISGSVAKGVHRAFSRKVHHYAN